MDIKERTKKIKEIEYVFNNKIVTKNTGTIIMAYNPENGDMYEFNDIGGEIFSIIQKKSTVNDVFVELTSRYDVTEEDVLDDVEDFMGRLKELNIIMLTNKQGCDKVEIY